MVVGRDEERFKEGSVSEVPDCVAAARAEDHVGSMKRNVSCPPRPDLVPLLYSLPTFGGGE
jgi:hypothetical protein